MSRRPLSWKQQLLGLSLQPEDALARLFQFHQAAIDAETGQAFARADFFWRQAHDAFAVAWPQEQTWRFARDLVATSPALKETLTSDDVREAVLEEVFVDTHWAFHLGFQARAWRHLQEIWTLTGRTQALSAPRQRALETATRREIGRLFQAAQWKPAGAIAELLVSRAPRTAHQDLIGLAVYRQGMSQVKSDSSSSIQRANAATLDRTAQRLEQVRIRFDRNALIYDLLAIVYRERAVCLANGGSAADALVEIKKARLYDPALDVEDLDRSLHKLMVDLQARAAQLQEAVRTRPNTQLSWQGQQIVRDAKRGFGPVEAFMQSEWPKRIRDGFVIVQGHSLVESAGMDGGTLTREQLWAIYQLYFSVRNQKPQGNEALESAWTTELSAHPTLKDVDLTKLCHLLQQRLAGTEPSSKPDTADAVWPRFLNPISSVRTPAIRDREPLGFWIFSPQDRIVKVAFAAALIVFLVALVVFMRDRRHHQLRDTAFAELRDARWAGDVERILDASERFLANSVFADDPRDAEVVDVYSAGMVQWAITHSTSDSDEQQHRARYRALVSQRMQ